MYIVPKNNKKKVTHITALQPSMVTNSKCFHVVCSCGWYSKLAGNKAFCKDLQSKHEYYNT